MERVRFYWRKRPVLQHGHSNTSLLAIRAAMKAQADLIACGLGSSICNVSRHRLNLLGLNFGPMLKNQLVLGIESSCDETGVALVETRGGAVPVLLSHALHSQIDMHQAYGGVVPELASRDHIRRVLPLTREVMAQAQRSLAQVDVIAYLCLSNSSSGRPMSLAI